MVYRLSTRSQSRLEGVERDLVRVVLLAITYSEVDFGVSEGVRSLERQLKLFNAGASGTMRSRHLTGHAVDLFAYIGRKAVWDFKQYKKINKAMQRAAKELGVPIVWGGTWKKPVDGPHFQLSKKRYPTKD